MDPILPLLIPLSRLDERDVAIADALRKAERQVAAAAAAVESAQARDAAASAALAALIAAERKDNESLAHFEHQRKMALRSLETGVGKSDVAERQLATCAAEIDRLETALLERMDGREPVEAERREARLALAAATEAREKVLADTGPRQAALIAEREANAAARAQGVEVLPPTERQTYEWLHRTRTTALSAVKDRSCSACGYGVPMQVASDLLKGRLGTCDGCRRWLYIPTAG